MRGDLYSRYMFRGISLANKCLLLFGGAVVLIVLTALVAPALRMWQLIDEGEVKMSRDRVDAWLALDVVGETGEDGHLYGPKLDKPQLESSRRGGIRAERITIDRARRLASEDVFLRRVVEAVDADPTIKEFQWAAWDGVTRVYDYARYEFAPRRILRGTGSGGSGGSGGSRRSGRGTGSARACTCRRLLHKRVVRKHIAFKIHGIVTLVPAQRGPQLARLDRVIGIKVKDHQSRLLVRFLGKR